MLLSDRWKRIQERGDYHFNLSVEILELLDEVSRKGFAIDHTHRMMCEALDKLDALAPSRKRQQKIAGRRRLEKPAFCLRDEKGRKLKEW